jgi:hypothetical protein
MRTNLVALMLLAGSVFAADISIGIRIGPPPPPRVVYAVPRSPGPDFIWVGGYWYPVGNHYKWHAGYWTRPPYAGARWMGPRHDGQRFFQGYWESDRGRRWEHDHHWDRDHRRRDFGRDHDHH